MKLHETPQINQQLNEKEKNPSSSTPEQPRFYSFLNSQYIHQLPTDNLKIKDMSDIDPDTLLEWLQTGNSDVTLLALEQLCTILLLSDNIDRCFESYPPRSFLPALCKIFLDELATEQVLEATARALTYYLDVSQECTRRIVAVDGTLRAICNRLLVIEVDNKTSKDLAEQCIKTLELICARESSAVFEAGGLNCILPFIVEHGKVIYKDSLHSAMSVVTRLCAKMEPTDSSLDFVVETLSKLLKHEDNYVADGALRCFASLSDRFTRKGVDPEPLAKYGLINELIRKLGDSVMSNNTNKWLQNSTNPGQSTQANEQNKSSTIVSISTLTGLLSTLCRSSDSIAKQILESNILDSIEKALYGDERCVLDTMRFLDLLLILIFEGRQGLPKQFTSLTKNQINTGTLNKNKKTDAQSDKLHRQLIEWIRIKDTDSFIEALETNQIDLNFMDDVGQTLLNWASAFGTAEMIEYLASKGADVNKGQRSSSLHYAACFGRVQIVKILLRYGANPDLRDEEGKTPLDKARERGEESHREVVQILQTSPCDLFKTNETELDTNQKENNEDLIEIKFLYTKRLMPIFSKIILNCMITSINKSCLNLLKKLISYSNQLNKVVQMDEKLTDLDNNNKKETIATLLVELISKILRDNLNYEQIQIGLGISSDLFKKCGDFIIDEFTRFGVADLISKIASQPIEIVDEEVDQDDEKVQENLFQKNKLYVWNSDWCFTYTDESIYAWNQMSLIELPNKSNGWFKYLTPNSLKLIYSDGKIVNLNNSDEFLHTFLTHKKSVESLSPEIIILAPDKQLKIENWNFKSLSESEIQIGCNLNLKQLVKIRKLFTGFDFESTLGDKILFESNESLGENFIIPQNLQTNLNKLNALQQYLAVATLKSNKLKQKQLKLNCIRLASKLKIDYLNKKENKPRDLVFKLKNLVNEVLIVCQEHDLDQVGWDIKFQKALNNLKEVLNESNKGISSYELSISGLIQVLLIALGENDSIKVTERRLIFSKIFNLDDTSLLVTLVHKLVNVLESNENLPVFLYDAPGSYNLQSFSKRFKLSLKKGSDLDLNCLDYTGRVLKVEPLANISHLEKYISKMVLKQWFDYDREGLYFLTSLDAQLPVEFNYEKDFDDNGILYWIGTNGKTSDWLNAFNHSNLIKMSYSDSMKQLSSGKHEDLIGRMASNCHTSGSEKRIWFVIDFGMFIIPSHYTLRYSNGFQKTAPRNWALLGSKTGGSSSNDWDILITHNNDDKLKDYGQSYTWSLGESQMVKQESTGWRFFRIQQTGRNQSGANYTMSISGFELYGTVTSLVKDKLVSVSLSSSTTRLSDSERRRQKRQSSRSSLQKQMILGARVQRGVDWKWGNQDKVSEECRPNEGTVITELDSNGWVEVIWDNGVFNFYRMGYESKYDLTMASSHDITKLSTYHAIAMQNLAMSKANLGNFNTINNLQIEMGLGNRQMTEEKKENCLRDKIKFKFEPDSKIAFTSLDNSLNTLMLNNNNLENLKKLTPIDLSKSGENDENFSQINPQVPCTNQNPQKFKKNLFTHSKVNILNKNRKSSSTPVLTMTESTSQTDLTFENLQELDQNMSSNQTLSSNNCENKIMDNFSSSNTLNDETFRTYFNNSIEPKKILRHFSLQNNHDKSQSANNLLTFNNSNQLQLTAVSEPNVLMDENSQKLKPVSSSSSSYFPLEPTMEECLENLDISYETKQDEETKSSTEDIFSKNLCSLITKSDLKQMLSKEEDMDEKDENYCPSEMDMFSNLFSKENSQDLELLLSTFSLFSQKKSQFNNLFKSLSSMKSLDETSKGDELSNQVWSAILSRLDSKTEEKCAKAEAEIQEIDDEDEMKQENEEDEEFMRAVEHIPNEETDENFDDDYLDEEDFEFSNKSVENGLKRMRELKRRHNVPVSSFGSRFSDNEPSSTHHDEFVLKCQFSALIPAFDPRPGKNNINQIQDITIPPNMNQITLNNSQNETPKNQKIDLYLKVDFNSQLKQLDFVQDEIKLTNKNATIFQYIQNLIQINCESSTSYEKMKTIWDMNYTLIYKESPLDSNEDTNLNNEQKSWENIEEILKLLDTLKKITDKNFVDEFISEKINNKLVQQLQDPLVLASRSIPDWCKHLLNSYKFLFPFETRQLYFTTTAFGVSRSIVWLQNKRDALLSNMRGPSTNRVARDDHEYRIGRLKHERIKIPREPTSELIESAINALIFHASRKAILEIEFMDEEGTGLGPTLEFFSLIAAELQRKKFALWHCDDSELHNELSQEELLNLNENFVHYKNGLFPAAYPNHLTETTHFKTVLNFFYFMGIFIAKSLQDQRLVDIPFSEQFLKIICSNDSDEIDLNILGLDDLCKIDPNRGDLLKQLKNGLEKYTSGEKDDVYVNLNNHEIKLEDLSLVFQYNPPSKVYMYEFYDLKENGGDLAVDRDNLDEYIDLMVNFVLKTGIEKQIKSFKEGFDSVFSMEALKCFDPYEFQLLLSGDQAPSWTYEEIMNYTEPKLGYTKESPGFLRFVNVMCQMDSTERKLFVQFLTGCSSLPPGGLANLHPRLTVVKKDGTDSSYPSVNTCVHYLKLPEYSSEEILSEQMMIACQEKGFYLN
ncbi:unnamed protein product [Brachionus calyciflorus]|uniref:E3 ubiquitin-protein ligase n=1 Tax=Brachionus calyciflorus TaxID=104777 RepID=A0A813ZU54_9BILA|nr:unnamed protein product [Brachionus calyciflorus]